MRWMLLLVATSAVAQRGPVPDESKLPKAMVGKYELPHITIEQPIPPGLEVVAVPPFHLVVGNHSQNPVVDVGMRFILMVDGVPKPEVFFWHDKPIGPGGFKVVMPVSHSTDKRIIDSAPYRATVAAQLDELSRAEAIDVAVILAAQVPFRNYDEQERAEQDSAWRAQRVPPIPTFFQPKRPTPLSPQPAVRK